MYEEKVALRGTQFLALPGSHDLAVKTAVLNSSLHLTPAQLGSSTHQLTAPGAIAADGLWVWSSTKLTISIIPVALTRANMGDAQDPIHREN